MNTSFKLIFLSLTLLSFEVQSATANETAKRWPSAIPKIADKSENWQKLVTELSQNKMQYGALSASHRMLNFFSDLPTKELAYRTIISLIDLGYSFSTRSFFVAGDLDPQSDDEFARSYNVYKGIVNVDKKMEKWATYYFGKVDKEKTAKYSFYIAIENYGKGKISEAESQLQKILENTKGLENLSIIKKSARTLARIYYEKEEFEKSLDIYETFLLKLNPIAPSDWIEAAWNLYRLKKYDEALGYIYNMDSKAAFDLVFLEKYVIRALIYREYCNVESTESLINSFDRDFGTVIEGIKLGEPLSVYPILRRIEHPQTQEYRQVMNTIDSLQREKKDVSRLSSSLRPMADYLYSSEIQMLDRRRKLLEDTAVDILSNHLVILGESLKFLKFDVAREKFNPDRVFKDLVPQSKVLVEDIDEKNFRLRWTQKGDYWRDERLLYRGLLRNQCDY